MSNVHLGQSSSWLTGWMKLWEMGHEIVSYPVVSGVLSQWSIMTNYSLRMRNKWPWLIVLPDGYKNAHTTTVINRPVASSLPEPRHPRDKSEAEIHLIFSRGPWNLTIKMSVSFCFRLSFLCPVSFSSFSSIHAQKYDQIRKLASSWPIAPWEVKGLNSIEGKCKKGITMFKVHELSGALFTKKLTLKNSLEILVFDGVRYVIHP